MKQHIKLSPIIPTSLFLVIVSCSLLKTTGKNPSGSEFTKAKELPNYKDGHFENIDADAQNNVKFLKIFKEMNSRPQTVKPHGILPFVKVDLIHIVYSKPTVIWFGHSSFLIKTKSANILVDPDFSGYAGPISWLIKAFPGSNTYQVEDMPEIHVLIISHDHYDHLDYETVKKLKTKVKMVIVPLGVGSHFMRWGYDPKIVHELNWNQSVKVSDQLTVTATPARHRSGRTFSTNKTLWASYVIHTDGFKIFYSGDSGYGSNFQLIGQQYGPFDLAMLECGQYGHNWAHAHMFPQQTARAAVDLKAKMIIPVHWAKFAESTHPWNEPVKLMLLSADSLNVHVSIPEIGQPYTIGDPPDIKKWWELN